MIIFIATQILKDLERTSQEVKHFEIYHVDTGLVEYLCQSRDEHWRIPSATLCKGITCQACIEFFYSRS